MAGNGGIIGPVNTVCATCQAETITYKTASGSVTTQPGTTTATMLLIAGGGGGSAQRGGGGGAGQAGGVIPAANQAIAPLFLNHCLQSINGSFWWRT